MTVWSWLGPALYDPFLALGEVRGLRALRRALLSEARGRVLEIGAGTGLNLRHYPSVEELVLAEPDPQMARRLTRRSKRHELSPRVVEAPAEKLPFDTDSFDTVASTLVLCTVPDPASALQEIRRVLKPAGRFLFLEHVRSDSPRFARWQDRLQPAWGPFAMGCRCNRDLHTSLLDAGWTVNSLQHGSWRGMPSIVKPLIAGSASPRCQSA